MKFKLLFHTVLICNIHHADDGVRRTNHFPSYHQFAKLPRDQHHITAPAYTTGRKKKRKTLRNWRSAKLLLIDWHAEEKNEGTKRVASQEENVRASCNSLNNTRRSRGSDDGHTPGNSRAGHRWEIALFRGHAAIMKFEPPTHYIHRALWLYLYILCPRSATKRRWGWKNRAVY